MELIQTSESDRTEFLRVILEREQDRPVSYQEAKQTGEWLVGFYEALGESSAEPDENETAVAG